MEEASGRHPGDGRRPQRTRRWSKALESSHGAHHPPHPSGSMEVTRRVPQGSDATITRAQPSGSAARGSGEGHHRSDACELSQQTEHLLRRLRTMVERGPLRGGRGKDRRSAHLPERGGERGASELGEQPRRSRGLWRGSPGDPLEEPLMSLRVRQGPTSSSAARRGRGAAASSGPERAPGRRCSPRHGNARSAAWPRGNPGVERVEGVHDRAASTETRRPVCRQARSAAQKVARRGLRSQRSRKTRCAAQEAASADRKATDIGCGDHSSGSARERRVQSSGTALRAQVSRAGGFGAHPSLDLRVRGDAGERQEGRGRREALGCRRGEVFEGSKHDEERAKAPAFVRLPPRWSGARDGGVHPRKRREPRIRHQAARCLGSREVENR
jgi:hypothetical protein